MRGFSLLGGFILLLLGACSLSPAINADVVEYFQVGDLAANRIILLNILRASDGAPLHFSELSQVRGQLTAGASASTTFPFGPLAHATTLPRRLATIGGSVSSSPSFDIASLDTQDFTKGVMSPITPATVKFFLNEGQDYRLVLMLLTSGVRLAQNAETLLNAPNSSRIVCYNKVLGTDEMPERYSILAANEAGKCPPHQSETEYYGFLRVINNMHRVYAVSHRQPRPVGSPFTLDMNRDLRAIAALDPTKYTLRRLPSGQFQLAALARGDSTILCREAEPGTGAPPKVISAFGEASEEMTAIPNDVCIPGEERSASESRPGHPEEAVRIGTDPGTLVFTLRSTLEVINYVGQVLAFQDAETHDQQHNPQGLERCVTVEYESLTGPTCTGGTLFHLEHSLDFATAGVDYGGQGWSLPAPKTCTDAERCDHTLQVMSIISLLLNQNKSAKDIQTTPAVQALP